MYKPVRETRYSLHKHMFELYLDIKGKNVPTCPMMGFIYTSVKPVNTHRDMYSVHVHAHGHACASMHVRLLL